MATQEKMINSNLLLPVLPTNITIDILSRLSVELVLSCKRVCKTWRALIDDTAFAQAHTNRFLLLDDDEKQQKSAETFECFLSTLRSNSGKYNFVEYSTDHHDQEEITFKLHKSITHDYPFSLPLDRYSRFHNSFWLETYWIPIGSCNGLICLASRVIGDHNMCVYNPLTREYVNLPLINSISSSTNYYHPAGDLVGTGFGYHPCTKEYKVVRIYHKPCHYNSYLSLRQTTHVSVYTLGSGSSSTTGWRSKGETEHWLRGEGVLAIGALHWYNVVTLGIHCMMDIVAFDLAKEEFRRVPSPPSADFGHSTKLGVLGGSLCVMMSKAIKVSELWVLSNNNSNQEEENCFSWTKKYSIPWYNPAIPYCSPPLALSKGGEILLQYDYMEKISSSSSKITTIYHKRIISYDLKRRSRNVDDNFKAVGAISSMDANFHRCTIIPYLKSFVSLKALGEHGARIGCIAPLPEDFCVVQGSWTPWDPCLHGKLVIR